MTYNQADELFIGNIGAVDDAAESEDAHKPFRDIADRALTEAFHEAGFDMDFFPSSNINVEVGSLRLNVQLEDDYIKLFSDSTDEVLYETFPLDDHQKAAEVGINFLNKNM